MSNVSGGASTVCPFYLRETDHSLTCEGCVRGSVTILRFGCRTDKRAWQAGICAHYHFRRCPLAFSAELKYERALMQGGGQA